MSAGARAARTRTIAVLAILLGGAVAIIASTQSWMHVVLHSDEAGELAVAGADAVPLLAPLSLAALALGLALTVAGRVLRYLFGAIAVSIGVTMAVTAVRVAATQPLDAVAAAITEATGLAGAAAIAGLVAQVTTTIWPWLTAVAAVLIVAGGTLTLATAHRGKAGGRRYRTDAGPGAAGSRPHDAIDSWDDLSRGDDPTDR